MSVGFIIYPSGWVVEGADGEGLSYVQTAYLISQIITTSGYGDLTPKTTFGMLFTAVYVLFCGLIVSGAIFELLEKLSDDNQAGTNALVGGFFDDGDPLTESFLERHKSFLLSIFAFCLSVFIWTAFFVIYCEDYEWDFSQFIPHVKDTHGCEDMCWSRAFYFAVISMTGVGFGDVVPKTEAGRLFCAIASFIGLALYLNLLENIGSKLLHNKQMARIEALSDQDILAADDNADGTLDAFEFAKFMLVRYDLVSEEMLDNIRKNFDELDCDQSGYITTKDLAMAVDQHAKRSKAA